MSRAFFASGVLLISLFTTACGNRGGAAPSQTASVPLSARAVQVCTGDVSIPNHPELSGTYNVEVDSDEAVVFLRSTTYVLTTCQRSIYGGFCHSSNYPTFSVGWGDTPGVGLGAYYGPNNKDYLSLGTLHNCRLL